ncbi:MAG: hypothetical protein EHM58_01390 [Ignavibacteriae bacterium]|nr:MAG: hypothetical protein EHM58_01390 [Ignavibacteriota bacterium]
MRKKRGIIKAQPYKYELQVGNMRAKLPQFTAKKTPEGYDFIGVLNPRGTEYKVQIKYRKNNHPVVFVLNPVITTNKHRYTDGSLCIYKQPEFRWREDLLVCNYIVPLTCMWLHFYELYLEHGRWFGPEAEHDSGSDIRKKRIEMPEE